MNASLIVCSSDDVGREKAQIFSSVYKIPFENEKKSDFMLEFSQGGVCLVDARSGKPIKIEVDFTAGAAAHRMKYGGGKSQAIAKAIGVSVQLKPTVLDATAGLGKDAFVLAGLGCGVTMLERSPVAYVLLEDGLRRALQFVQEHTEEEYGQLKETVRRMKLINQDALNYLVSAKKNSINVVYLDPMFPERKKSAQVKKDMLVFQELIGKDVDADDLLEYALEIAENRVVVKRPNYAPFLAEKKPNYELKGKSSRFDIYTKKKLQ